VHDADPSQPLSDVRTAAEIVAGETASRVSQLRLLGVLAAIALLLSSVGIHGLLSFTVARRSHEIGVRMALGAQAGDVARLVVREGMLLALGGLVPGVAIAFAAAWGMRALLAGVQPDDATTFGVAVALCATATMAGSLWPARRAARLDPTAALRAE
jgi:putative ABC transport system permease protein